MVVAFPGLYRRMLDRLGSYILPYTLRRPSMRTGIVLRRIFLEHQLVCSDLLQAPLSHPPPFKVYLLVTSHPPPPLPERALTTENPTEQTRKGTKLETMRRHNERMVWSSAITMARVSNHRRSESADTMRSWLSSESFKVVLSNACTVIKKHAPHEQGLGGFFPQQSKDPGSGSSDYHQI